MQPELMNGPARAGTVGGTILVLILNTGPAELLHTAVLAATGATVSFIVSVILRYLFKRFTRK